MVPLYHQSSSPCCGSLHDKPIMSKVAILLFCLAVSSQAKTRNSRLPENVWKQPAMRMNIDEDLKIVGGHEVTPHSIPLQVSVQYRVNNFHFCGGSVIDEWTIVCAAHCVVGQVESQVQVLHDFNFFLSLSFSSLSLQPTSQPSIQ